MVFANYDVVCRNTVTLTDVHCATSSQFSWSAAEPNRGRRSEKPDPQNQGFYFEPFKYLTVCTAKYYFWHKCFIYVYTEEPS
jgi:hypothetical protein